MTTGTRPVISAVIGIAIHASVAVSCWGADAGGWVDPDPQYQPNWTARMAIRKQFLQQETQKQRQALGQLKALKEDRTLARLPIVKTGEIISKDAEGTPQIYATFLVFPSQEDPIWINVLVTGGRVAKEELVARLKEQMKSPDDRALWAALAHSLTPEEITRLLAGGRVSAHTPLGWTVEPSGQPMGLKITEVEPSSPAAKASLAKGDVITHVGAGPVASLNEFERAMQTYAPGAVVQLRVIHPPARQDRLVTLTLEGRVKGATMPKVAGSLPFETLLQQYEEGVWGTEEELANVKGLGSAEAYAQAHQPRVIIGQEVDLTNGEPRLVGQPQLLVPDTGIRIPLGPVGSREDALRVVENEFIEAQQLQEDNQEWKQRAEDAHLAFGWLSRMSDETFNHKVRESSQEFERTRVAQGPVSVVHAAIDETTGNITDIKTGEVVGNITDVNSLVANTFTKHQATGGNGRQWLGIEVTEVTPETAKLLGRTEAVYVKGIHPGSPGARAGFRVGDVILALEGGEVTDRESLIERIQGFAVGSRIMCEVWRGGIRVKVLVTLEAMPEGVVP